MTLLHVNRTGLAAACCRYLAQCHIYLLEGKHVAAGVASATLQCGLIASHTRALTLPQRHSLWKSAVWDTHHERQAHCTNTFHQTTAGWGCCSWHKALQRGEGHYFALPPGLLFGRSDTSCTHAVIKSILAPLIASSCTISEIMCSIMLLLQLDVVRSHARIRTRGMHV